VAGDLYAGTGSTTYSFNVAAIPPDTVGTLSLNTEVDGSINAPGQRSAYNFALDSSKRVYFDTLTANTNMTWTLTGPRGPRWRRTLSPLQTAITSTGRRHSTCRPQLRPSRIDGTGAVTGPFQFSPAGSCQRDTGHTRTE